MDGYVWCAAGFIAVIAAITFGWRIAREPQDRQ